MIQAILTDIEGTTTDIHFVHKILFPYSRLKMADFLEKNYKKPEIAAQIHLVQQLMSKPQATLSAITAQLTEWIDCDMKIGPLKVLQGYIWQQGFEQGEFKAHVYDDAYYQLLQWYNQGITLYVYSSGSRKAQQLLFEYSIFGDMRYLFNEYFDTQVGAKKDPSSYKAILQKLNLSGNEIMFLSDVVLELDAARENQIQTCLLNRQQEPINANAHHWVSRFDQIILEDSRRIDSYCQEP